MATPKNSVGKPLQFKSVEALKKKADAYFKKCDQNEKPYTMSGLALALGCSRQTLVNYSYKDEYVDTIKSYRAKIEAQLEEGLLTGRFNPTGAIFNLKNNYGWVDKQNIEADVDSNIQIRVDVSD